VGKPEGKRPHGRPRRGWEDNIKMDIQEVGKSRKMRWAGHVARMGERRGVYRVLMRKPEGKRPLGRPRRGWENNIKMDNQEVGKSGKMRWAGHVARMGERRGVYRILVGKPEGKRPLWRPRHRWEDNIKMDIQEVGCQSMDWIELAQNRDRWWALVNAAMNLRAP